MSFRENINRLHFDLSSKFEVSVEECQNKAGNYVKLLVKENNKELIVNIAKYSLENNVFDWTYSSNPLNENSENIERTSSVSGFLNDVSDIFEKNRFSEDYLKKLS
jgi:hypothetical protein